MESEKNLPELKERLAKNPAILLEKLSTATNASAAQLIECLPEEMWTKVSGTYFEEILRQLPSWGKVTTIVHTTDVVMEFSGVFPEGEISHGFYNLNSHGEGLHGHLRYKNCHVIYFVERPFKGMDTKSILFTNEQGDFMFKVFLGRDENRQIKTDQIVLFRELAQKLSASIESLI